MKLAFLSHDDLSFSVALAPHPALSPRRCKQAGATRGERDKGEGTCTFYATLGYTQTWQMIFHVEPHQEKFFSPTCKEWREVTGFGYGDLQCCR
jgi:hypothetical protein